MKETLFWKAMALAHKGKMDELRDEAHKKENERFNLIIKINAFTLNDSKKEPIKCDISKLDNEITYLIRQAVRKKHCYIKCLHKADSIEFEKITDNIAKEVLEKFDINVKDEINGLSRLLNLKELKESLYYCQSNKEKLNTQDDITKLLTIFPYIKKSFEMIKYNEKLFTEIMKFDTVSIKDVIQNLEIIMNKINKTIEIGKQNG